MALLEISERSYALLKQEFTRRTAASYAVRLRKIGAGDDVEAFIARELARLERCGITGSEDQWRWIQLAWTNRLPETPPARLAVIEHALSNPERTTEQRIDFIERLVFGSA